MTLGDDIMRVVGHLGSGGEGEVWQLESENGNEPLALKWFHVPNSTPARRTQMSALIKRGAPNRRFLWPQGMVDDTLHNRFGYVMDLRPDGFTGLAALLRGEVVRNEGAVVRFAYELAASFRDLHLRGLCYRDINFGNAFMHPVTGEALICDNDNIGVEGVTDAQVLGAKQFMAPEIVRSEALPSKHTDRFSLAVMLFYLLVVHHPLEGARTEQGLSDPAAHLHHYGLEPVFCFDPDDDSNRPVPGLHDHVPGMWNALPDAVRTLFTRSFTNGLDHPSRRVVDSEWCSALAEMRSTLVNCDTCGRAGFLGVSGGSWSCPHCAGRQDVLTVAIGRNTVTLHPGAVVARHHISGDLDFDNLIGTVEEHPTKPGLLGLRNDTDSSLLFRDDNVTSEVPPGRRAPLRPGARLEVGKRTLVVREV